MPKSIVNQPSPSQVSGRLATWHRVMEEAGLEYADLQTPIDDPDFRIRLVNFWRAGAVLESAPQTEQTKPQLIALPEVGAEFELTLDPVVKGLGLVTAFGYSGNWNMKQGRQPIWEPPTRRFKLVQVGACRDLNEVATKCAPHGRVPEGEFMDAFCKKYPQNDGQGPIGIADASWLDPYGNADFPCAFAGGGWTRGFDWSGLGRGAGWRWLVEVPGPGKLEA